MPLDYLAQNLWPGPLIWTILYISDYYCTIAAAQMARQGVDNHIGLEKGYELTPYYQADIARLKKVSWRFLLQLALSNVSLCAMWYMCPLAQIPQMYEFFLGALVLSELTIHERHLRNISSYLYYRRSHGLRGKISITHWLGLRLSSLDLLAFGVIWILLFAVTFRWFFAGGAFKCLVTAYQHWELSNKEPSPRSGMQVDEVSQIPVDPRELPEADSVE